MRIGYQLFFEKNAIIDCLLSVYYFLSKMLFQIETKRLLLRDILPDDDKGLFELDSNPEVHRYLGNQPIQKIEQAQEAIDRIRQQYIDNGIGRWAVIEQSSGEFIGWSGLKWVTESENKNKPHAYYDVGYRLIPKFWGKGYATESAKAALTFGFEQLQVTTIIGTCNENNKASRKVLEKCGLVFEEKFLYKNELICDWLSITKEFWKNGQTEIEN